MVGECKFDMVVIPVPAANYIDIDGESPKVVIRGECQTMSVSGGGWLWGSNKNNWSIN